ncbi:MAG TPA: hypothetical protein VMC10_14875 [Stellaceae bacterium]|nr:hypothetical protein [Stellaceae bacterium]
MADADEHRIVKTTNEARQGTTPGITRYVLVFSTGLVVIALIAAYYFTIG